MPAIDIRDVAKYHIQAMEQIDRFDGEIILLSSRTIPFIEIAHILR